MAKSKGLAAAYDAIPWILRLLLSLFFGFAVGCIYRLFKGRIVIAILWFITGGLFAIGWIIDVVTIIFTKKITFLA